MIVISIVVLVIGFVAYKLYENILEPYFTYKKLLTMPGVMEVPGSSLLTGHISEMVRMRKENKTPNRFLTDYLLANFDKIKDNELLLVRTGPSISLYALN